MDSNTDDWNALSPAEKAASLEAQADVATKDEQHQLACSYYIQSLNLYRGIGDKRGQLRVLTSVSYLSGWADFGDGLGMDMFTRRQRLAEEALPLARELGDPERLAHALIAFSACHVGSPKAAAMLEEALTIAEAQGDKRTQAAALSTLGNHWGLRQDKQRAIALQERALALYTELGNLGGQAQTLRSMALQVDAPQNEAYLEQALALYRTRDSARGIYETLRMLAMFATSDKKAGYVQELFVLAKAKGDPRGAARCLDQLAELARERGDTDRAEQFAAESRTLYTPTPEELQQQAAFEKAFAKGNSDAAIQRLFSSRTRRGKSGSA